MEKNNFQKEIKKDFNRVIKGLENEIKLTKEFHKNYIEAARIGAEVIILTTSLKGIFAIYSAKEGFVLSQTNKKQKLLEIIKENGWVLVENNKQ